MTEKTASNAKPKILVILGPTASGKSDLAVSLAEWVAETGVGGYTGVEIISADSRQVYRHLDIGTGKITPKEARGIPHHLIDIIDPDQRFTAMEWKKAAQAAIADIIARGKLPIVCGGTGFYISSLIDDLGFPEVEADAGEQEVLEAKPVEELFAELVKLDPERASTIDMKNKRRLSRAIIIARALGKVPAVTEPAEAPYDVIQIGISMPDADLRARIKARLISRMNKGMIEEAEKLHAAPPTGVSLSYERMDELGLEYRYLALYLQMQITRDDLIETLCAKIWQYAKRQKLWWKKDVRIHWFAPEAFDKIDALVKPFLEKK